MGGQTSLLELARPPPVAAAAQATTWSPVTISKLAQDASSLGACVSEKCGQGRAPLQTGHHSTGRASPRQPLVVADMLRGSKPCVWRGMRGELRLGFQTAYG